MMKTLRAPAFVVLAVSFVVCLLASVAGRAHAQAVNTSQTVTLAGLRAAAGHGSFPAAAFAPDGSLFVLYNAGDGVRVLKLNATGTTVLAQAQLGDAGDVPIAMALDPTGSVYVTGTSTSGQLSGTSGAAFQAPADTSTNSFVAKFDGSLTTRFVTFLGSGRTAAAAVSATADAVFVTGITFNSAFPVTSSGIQQAPATGSSENGFVERLSADGSTLVYATYLTGTNGSTIPAGIVADSSDNATIAGSTTSTGYPTIGALVPRSADAVSGFLTRLTPAGDGFLFSTFIPGSGITGLALDSSTPALLLVGNVAAGEFPLTSALVPLGPVPYLSLLRLPLDGQSVTSATVLVPGTQGSVASGPGGAVWVTGSGGPAEFPGTSQPLALFGDSFALHITAANTVDQTLRFGGQPAGTFGNNSLASSLGAAAVSAAGTSAVFPGTLSATIGSGLAPATRFDLPLVAAPTAALPSTLRDVAGACPASGQCTVSAGYLSGVAIGGTAAAPALALSVDSSPNLVLRNLGSAAAAGLSLSASGFTLQTDCAASLPPSGICAIALSGSGPGTLTVSAANSPSTTVTLPAISAVADPLAVFPAELDFGIQTAGSAPARQTLTVTNLSATPQTFASQTDGATAANGYTVTEAASTCVAASGGKTLAAGASCTITLGLAVSASSSNDGAVRATWKVGTHDIALTGIGEAAAFSLSSTAVDFGTLIAGGPRTPRALFLSNNATVAAGHTAVTLPAASPFSIADDCPGTLQPQTVCRLALAYGATSAPSTDAVTLTLDGGATVLVTGRLLPQSTTSSSTPNPSVAVTPSTVTFTSPVLVTGVSTETHTVVLKNTGTSPQPITVASAGDFLMQNGCPASLLASSSCQLIVSFAPTAPGTRQGLLAITAGSGFSPAYVSLTGNGAALLPANNGTLDLGQTLVGEPAVMYFKLSQAVSPLTFATNNAAFEVALVEELGYGHGSLPPSAFASSVTGTCSNCYLALQFLSQTSGAQAATLTLSTAAGGNPEIFALTATAQPITGLLLTPVASDFGPVSLNSSSAPHTFTLTNLLASGAPATIASVAATGDFTASTTGAQACSGTLAYTASCFLQITFAPTVVEQRGGTVSVATSAGTATASLSGYGLGDPGVALNPSELAFNPGGGTSSTQQTVLVSNTGRVPIQIGTITPSSASFVAASRCSAVAPGAVCAIAVTYLPGSADATGTLAIPVTSTVNGQTSTPTYTVALNGLYTSEDAGLQILPAQVNFGTQAMATPGVPRQFTLTNLTGKTVAVQLSLPRQFPLAGTSSCTSLVPQGSCTFSAEYLPAVSSEATGTVLATATPTDGSAPLQAIAYMQGYGSGSASLTVTGNPIPNAPLRFGQVTSGQTAAQTLTLTNSGTVPVTVRRITTEPPFYAASACGAALAAQQSCSVTLTYAPVNQVAAGSASTAARADTGMLLLESDAAASPQVVDLAGSAAAVPVASPANPSVISSFLPSNEALTFGHVTVGNASAAQTVTLTNNGTTTLHVLGVATSADFSATGNACAAVLPAATCTLTVSFTPSNALSGSTRSSTLEISSDATVALDFLTLIGVADPPSLTLAPATLDFGTVNVGGSGSLSATVTNGTALPVTLLAVAATGDFSAASGTCPPAGGTLAGGSSCSLTVMFTPSAAGTRSGTLSLSTSATTLPLTAALTGVATLAHLQITPGALAFGSVAAGATANLTLALLNTGSATVTNIATAITGPAAADFVVTVPCSVAALAPNQGCTATVSFTPSAATNRTATLAIASSDPSSPAVIPLTGTGLPASIAGSFTLTANGGASASATVKSGSPASYSLLVTPIAGFIGNVALTCAPVVAATYATCSISPSTVALNATAQASTVTINTITQASNDVRGPVTFVLAWLWLPILLFQRGYRKRSASLNRLWLAPLIGFLAAAALTGCGSGNSALYTPAGTYQYRVTASSTTGTVVQQSVTLNLTVQ